MTNSESIPMPTETVGYTPAELRKLERERAALEADPRTAGSANRSPRLVAMVLAAAERKRLETAIVLLEEYAAGGAQAEMNPALGMLHRDLCALDRRYTDDEVRS